MNLSKAKVRFSTNLVKLAHYFVTNRNGFNKSAFLLLKYVTKKSTGYNLYEIRNVKDYCQEYDLAYNVLRSDRIGYSWTSASNLNGMNSQMICEILPDIALAKLQDVYITSNSDYIVNHKEGIVVNDYCANNSDENKTYVDGITLAYWGRCCLTKSIKDKETIPTGIMLSGKFAFNYYHNMYENLIRFMLVDEYGNNLPADIPIIFDEEVLVIPSLKLIFDLFINKTNRKVITISRYKEYKIESLYYFTGINLLTPQHVNPSVGKATDFLFDKHYVKKYANELLRLGCDKVFPKRIFITRANVKKRNFNEEEVFDVLKPLGFVSVAPEKLSFQEQIALFHGADIIVGGSGAAFTNMLFASKGCRAFIIISRGGMPSACFNAPAYINGAEISFYQSSDKMNNGIHADFSVDIDQFSSYVQDYIAPLCK